MDAIDRSEDRERFQELIQKLDLKQPANATVKNISEAMIEAEKIGFPIVVRPSYVLGGRAMQLVHNLNELELYLNEAVEVSNSKPILLDSYLTDAVEVDVDVVSDGIDIQVGGILQHIEQAGIHSGDSACSLPPYSLSEEIQKEICDQSIKIGKELDILGLMNIQFAVKDDVVYIIENKKKFALCAHMSKCLLTAWPSAHVCAPSAHVESEMRVNDRCQVSNPFPPVALLFLKTTFLI